MTMSSFTEIKNATFDHMLPPKADPARVGLVAAGNPNVISEAEGNEPYARKRKRGGRVKHAISGAHARHRLDRGSRRKRADGGDASAQPAQTPPPAAAPSSWLPPRFQSIGQGASVLNNGAEAVGRGVAAGLMAIDRASHQLSGTTPAYRRGGSARR
jgi:hypothetical protein